MTIIKIPYGDRTVHVDISTANSRGIGFGELVQIKMRKDDISYNQAFAECWADPAFSQLVEAIKTRGRSCS